MTEASKAAFQEAVPQFRGRNATIYQLIVAQSHEYVAEAYRGATIKEMCEATGWPHNIVSARVSDVCDAGKVKAAGVRGGQTVWVPAASEEEEQLRVARQLAKGTKGSVVGRRSFADHDILEVRVPAGCRRFVGDAVRVL